MNICATCGEPVSPSSSVCPYCETPQPSTSPAGRGAKGPDVRNLDIEAGLPTVEEAMRRLQTQLERARSDGVRVVRIIHGWGSSSGGGGKIRMAARNWLRTQLDTRRIRSVFLGDHYTHTSPEGRDFLRRHPALRPTENSDRNNPGITFVEL